MAALMIMFSQGGPQWWLASIIIFGLPILDTSVAFARRIINKKPLFVSDRGHIYDQMMDRGISLKKTVNLCYGLSAVYVLAGLVLSQLRLSWAIAACIAAAVVSVLVVWKKGYLKMAGLRGAAPQNPPPKNHDYQRPIGHGPATSVHRTIPPVTGLTDPPDFKNFDT